MGHPVYDVHSGDGKREKYGGRETKRESEVCLTFFFEEIIINTAY